MFQRPSLEQLVVRTGLGRVSPRALLLPVLCLAWRLEEQRRALAIFHRVVQVPSMRWIAVVLDVLSCRRIRQPVFVFRPDLLHDSNHSLLLLFFGGRLERSDDGRWDLGGCRASSERDEVWRGLDGDGGV